MAISLCRFFALAKRGEQAYAAHLSGAVDDILAVGVDGQAVDIVEPGLIYGPGSCLDHRNHGFKGTITRGLFRPTGDRDILKQIYDIRTL